MSRIRLLSEQVANQIAAGEVVERPASVVKELLENSLDAGAKHIDIQVENGGTSLLRVGDDGEGMDKDDVLLSLERHATSKLRSAEDLQAITSLGFRGEAIPSIASVSWLTILSRRREQELGTRAEMRYGVLREVREEGASVGTVMEVQHLFGNMPARKKFLKSLRTELFHIEEVVKNQALIHPETGFSLRVNGRMLFAYQPGATAENRLREIFRYQESLLPLTSIGSESVGKDGDSNKSAVEGFLLLPEKTTASSVPLRIFVNKRPVQDSLLRYAVKDAMQGFLMRGYQPAGLLHIRLPAEEVDVNVHPAKREVRFKKSGEVRQVVEKSVHEAMRFYQESLRHDIFSRSDVRQAPPLTIFQDGPQATLEVAEPAGIFSSADRIEQGAHLPYTLQEPLVKPRVAEAASSVQTVQHESEQQEEPEFAGLRMIGQLFSLYLLCERQGQFIVIDQHAAHERILYGKLREAYLQRQVPAQALLFPVSIELTLQQNEIMEEKLFLVRSMGLAASHFGETTWVISQVPALLSNLEPEALLLEILETLTSARSISDPERRIPSSVDELFSSLACKAAIKGGSRLHGQEMLDLLTQMEKSEVFSHCPHGRPVIKVFQTSEVEKWFHRHGRG